MNLTHREVFELGIEQGRGAQLSDEQRLAMEQHLAGCEACRLEARIVEKLSQEALERWPVSMRPSLDDQAMIASIRERFQRRRTIQNLFRPTPGLAWVGGAVLLVLFLSWMIVNLVTRPGEQPAGPAGTTPEGTRMPEATPEPVVPKAPLDPIFKAPFIRFGRLSPTGEYLYFLADNPQELGRTLASAQLHFFGTSSGRICTSADLSFSQADSVNGFAWLPDGRLLLVDAAGEVLALLPCETEPARRLTTLFPDVMERLYAPSPGAESILLKGREFYWLYEPDGDRVRRIDAFRPGFIPGSDRLAFSPSGNRLAASVMNGATGQEGSRLFVLDLEMLTIVAELDLPGNENQSAPWVDWLSEDWLVLPDPEKALLVNLSGGEVKPVDLYKDIFQLEISEPFDVPSLDYKWDLETNSFHLAAASYIGGVHRIHLYHSEDGRVETLEQESETILILPNREVLYAQYWEDTPTYRDEYEIIWIDSDRPARRLTIEEHTPRQYPQLFPQILSTEFLAFSSSQGVSLYSLEDGRRLGFWLLREYQGLGMPDVLLVQSASGLLVSADLWESGQPGGLSGLYFIPLP